MEDNNNLRDFLKNKLHQVDDTTDGWDAPNPQIWENVQKDHLTPQKRPIILPFFWKAAAILLLLGMIGYNWHLQQQLNTLELQFAQQSQNLNETAQIIAQQKQQLIDQQSIQQDNNKLLSTIQRLKDQYQTTIQQNQQTQIPTTPQYNTPVVAQQQATNNDLAPISPVPAPNVDLVDDIDTPTSTIATLLADDLHPNNATALDCTLKKQPNLQTTYDKQLEIGYALGLLGLQKPTRIKLGPEIHKGKHEAIDHLTFTSHNVSVAYSPKQNWWVKSGLLLAKGANLQKVHIKTGYDKSTEQIDNNGNTTNSFLVQQDNSYTSSTNAINITIPNDINIANDELITTNLIQEEEIRVLQIPISVGYRLYNNKWFWDFQGGAVWNRLSFDKKKTLTTVKVKGLQLPTNQINTIEPPIQTKQFWALQGGIGLGYQVNNNLFVKADLNYRLDRHFLNKSFQLGIGYQLL